MNPSNLTLGPNLPKELLDTVPALIWAADAEHNRIYFNKSWLDFTGRTFEQEMGNGWLERIHPADLPHATAEYTASQKDKAPFSIEYRLLHHNGEYSNMLDSGTPWFNAEGVFQGFIGSCIDITERKRTEDNQLFLSRANELLSSSLDLKATLKRIAHLAVPLFADWCSVDLVDSHGVIKQVALTHADPAKMRWAKAYAKENPAPVDESRGVPKVIRTGKSEMMELIPKELLEAAIQTEEQRQILDMLQLKSYMIVPMKIRGEVLGAISFVSCGDSICYNRDDLEAAEELATYAGMAIENARLYDTVKKELAEKVTIEQSLRKSEERFRRLAESDLLGVAFFNLNTQLFTEANATFLSALGFTREDLNKARVGNSLLTPLEWKSVDTSAHAKLLESGSFTPYEKEYFRKDGSRLPILIGGTLFEGSKEEGVVFMLDISDRKTNELALQHQALHDVLTDLPNRTLLHDRLHVAIEQAKRTGTKCAVLFLDLDHFKNINDTLGHQAGDQLLVELTARLNGITREGDTLSRFGGDEFVIVASGLDHGREAVAIVNKIFNSLEEPFFVEDRQIYLNTSIGISLYPENGDSAADLIKHADIALYQAKESGRQSYAFFNTEDHFLAGNTLDIEAEMRTALKKHEFEVYYQPILRMDKEVASLIGVEALVRWNHPERGLLLPGNFIPYAENNGLIYQIGNWMLNSACHQISSWKQEHFDTVPISVNISPLEFYRKDFVPGFKSAIAEAGIAASNLVVEITENLALRNVETAISKLHTLKDMGAVIAVDDFGIGHSSLNYLKRLPIDKLKIDRSFVQGSPKHAADSAIIQAVGTLAHNLHLDVVAEGVETRNQLLHLLSMGCCDEMQGFYFSKPLPADEFMKFAENVRKNTTQFSLA